MTELIFGGVASTALLSFSVGVSYWVGYRRGSKWVLGEWKKFNEEVGYKDGK